MKATTAPTVKSPRHTSAPPRIYRATSTPHESTISVKRFHASVILPFSRTERSSRRSLPKASFLCLPRFHKCTSPIPSRVSSDHRENRLLASMSFRIFSSRRAESRRTERYFKGIMASTAMASPGLMRKSPAEPLTMRNTYPALITMYLSVTDVTCIISSVRQLIISPFFLSEKKSFLRRSTLSNTCRETAS